MLCETSRSVVYRGATTRVVRRGVSGGVGGSLAVGVDVDGAHWRWRWGDCGLR